MIEKVSHHISKHLEFSQKYFTVPASQVKTQLCILASSRQRLCSKDNNSTKTQKRHVFLQKIMAIQLSEIYTFSTVQPRKSHLSYDLKTELRNDPHHFTGLVIGLNPRSPSNGRSFSLSVIF